MKITQSQQNPTDSTTLSAEPERIFFSYNDLIEESDQDNLATIRDALTACYFQIGDIALKYVKGNAHKNALKVSSERIYEAVGYFCGRTARTVRYYAENSIFFPTDVREAYKELPFSYFDLARSFGDQWRSVLDYAMENFTMNYDSVAYNCRKMFILGEPIVQERAENVSREDFMEENISTKPLCELPTKGVSVTQSGARLLILLNSMSDLADKITKLSRDINLSAEAVIRLNDSLEGLRFVIPQVAALVDKNKT